MRFLNTVVLGLLLTAPALAQQPAGAQGEPVARAAGKVLRVDEAARLIAANPQVQADSAIVRALAGRWTDYALLATAWSDDTTLAMLDLDRLAQPQREGLVLSHLVEREVRIDTVFSDAQLARAWPELGAGVEVRARHILLRLPPNATPAQRDSVRRQAERIRAEAAGGADFAALARRHSQDENGQEGGDLGYFGRGTMVPTFDEAVFALQPGQVSPVVETPFGLHVIRLEDRRTREMGGDREQFRQYMAGRARQEAVQRYVDSLSTAARLTVGAGAVGAVRDIARAAAGSAPRPADAGRVLVTFAGGQLTAADMAQLLAQAPPEAAQEVAQAPDSTLQTMVREQAQRKLLLAEAGKLGIQPTPQEVQQLRTDTRDALRQAVTISGVAERRAPRGAAGNAAIESLLQELLRQALVGQRQLPPLGMLGAQLRSLYPSGFNAGSTPSVLERVRSIRAAQPAAAPAPRP